MIFHVFTQDQGLDTIAEGLDTLKNMAHDMTEVRYHFLYLPMLFCIQGSQFITS